MAGPTERCMDFMFVSGGKRLSCNCCRWYKLFDLGLSGYASNEFVRKGVLDVWLECSEYFESD